MAKGGNGVTLQSQGKSWVTAVLSLVFAAVTALCVTMVGFTSFTSFDPPGWIRITTMAPLPVALIGSVALAIVGLRQGSGRAWAVMALALDGIAVSAFIVMIASGG